MIQQREDWEGQYGMDKRHDFVSKGGGAASRYAHYDAKRVHERQIRCGGLDCENNEEDHNPTRPTHDWQRPQFGGHAHDS
jgi:hypothetical protein